MEKAKEEEAHWETLGDAQEEAQTECPWKKFKKRHWRKPKGRL